MIETDRHGQDRLTPGALEEELRTFQQFGKRTDRSSTTVDWNGCAFSLDTYTNEFWTSKQRAAHSLHEVAYRACFKPQLPRFFIERLTSPGDRVYDPFMGRGTTLLEAALLGRAAVGCDINPLSAMLIEPRLSPPTFDEVAARLGAIDFSRGEEGPEELLVFYHPETLREICALKKYLLERVAGGQLDRIDQWIRMVAVNRLAGHSPGFFSVYSLPPNQAVSVESQKKINALRGQVPPRRLVPRLILKRTRSLLKDLEAATRDILSGVETQVITSLAQDTPSLPSESVSLVVTSPPFLNVVDYARDNWLRCWFCGIDATRIQWTVPGGLKRWAGCMTAVFVELARVLKMGGHVAFEVGEVRKGRVKLEEVVIPCGLKASLTPVLVLVNDQKFTKTSHCWGVDNNQKGTNSNRIVVFRKEKGLGSP